MEQLIAISICYATGLEYGCKMGGIRSFRYKNIFGWILDEKKIIECEHVFRHPADLLNKPIKIFKKEGDKSTILIDAPVKNVGEDEKQWIIKSSEAHSFFFKKIINRAQAKNSLVLIKHLSDLGLPVPRLYAYLWEKGKVDRYYLIAEGLYESVNLALLERNQKERFSSLLDDGLVEKLVVALATFHKNGYAHGDVKWSNIVILKNGNFRFVDVEHVKKPLGFFAQRLFVKDLARFLIAAQEAGLDERDMTGIIKTYSVSRSLSQQKVVEELRPQIKKLSIRKNLPLPGFIENHI